LRRSIPGSGADRQPQPWRFTTSIANGQDLLLYRTLDLPEIPPAPDEVQRGIAVAAAYFEDKLGGAPRRCITRASDTAGHAGRRVRPLDRRSRS
jgi:hypothetical protein